MNSQPACMLPSAKPSMANCKILDIPWSTGLNILYFQSHLYPSRKLISSYFWKDTMKLIIPYQKTTWCLTITKVGVMRSGGSLRSLSPPNQGRNSFPSKFLSSWLKKVIANQLLQFWPQLLVQEGFFKNIGSNAATRSKGISLIVSIYTDCSFTKVYVYIKVVN